MSVRVALPPTPTFTFAPLLRQPLSPPQAATPYHHIMATLCHKPPIFNNTGRHLDFHRKPRANVRLSTAPFAHTMAPKSGPLTRCPVETSFHPPTNRRDSATQCEADAEDDFLSRIRGTTGWCARGGDGASSASSSRTLSCDSSMRPEYQPLPRLRRENAFKIKSDAAEAEFFYRVGITCDDSAAVDAMGAMSEDFDACTTQFPDFVGGDDNFFQ